MCRRPLIIVGCDGISASTPCALSERSSVFRSSIVAGRLVGSVAFTFRGQPTHTECFLGVVQQVDPDHYTDMGKFATALGARTGVWYEKRDRLYIAAPPSGVLGVLGARLLVFKAQTE